jgi:hypothetical protein
LYRLWSNVQSEQSGIKTASFDHPKLTGAIAALQAVKVAKTAYDNATNARELAFKPMKPLATKIVNAWQQQKPPSKQ